MNTPLSMNCTPIVRQRNSNDWGAFMSRHTFEDKLKAIDLYLNKRNSYRETAKLLLGTTYPFFNLKVFFIYLTLGGQSRIDKLFT
ncbi:hypothetical protein GFV16_13690 [Bacillus megaterium]|nr:hypothetical protein [Priestia megaterium]